MLIAILLPESRSDLSSEDKKILLERYGLDPHDLLFEPPPPPKVLSLSLFGFCLVAEKIENMKI